jgi:hypothetical protein
MSENPDIEEFQSTRFEDETDMLEYCYEKIETSTFIWALWCKAFASEMSHPVSEALLLDFVKTIYQDLSERVTARVDYDEAAHVLTGFIRKYREKSKPHAQETQE